MAFELCGIGVEQRHRLVDSGVVDQPVQPSHALGHHHRVAPLRLTRHIERLESAALPELLGQSTALVHQDIANDNAAALGNELPRLRPAKTARTAGDEKHLVGKSRHGGCLVRELYVENVSMPRPWNSRAAHKQALGGVTARSRAMVTTKGTAIVDLRARG